MSFLSPAFVKSAGITIVPVHGTIGLANNSNTHRIGVTRELILYSFFEDDSGTSYLMVADALATNRGLGGQT